MRRSLRTATHFNRRGWLRFPDPHANIHSTAIDGQSGPVLGKPLSASEVRHTEQILSDGSHTNNSETEHFYRDSMGRMRTETSTGAVIFDPVAGFTYDLNYKPQDLHQDPDSAEFRGYHRCRGAPFLDQFTQRQTQAKTG